jgi:feruloyl esterase
MKRKILMTSLVGCLVIVLLAISSLSLTVEAASAGPQVGATATPQPEPTDIAADEVCAALVDLELDQAVIVETQVITDVPWTSPKVVFGEGTVNSPFCRVFGQIEPDINFEVWLPPVEGDNAWNGKFNGVGNGGLAGELHYPAMADALARGYAVASTDTGHTGFLGDGSWALDRPDLMIDFGYRAIHETARAAKSVVEAYYEEAPAYSYFTGCSGGGQQGLSEVQRYPADYDGVVSGAPANFPTHMWPGELYPAWVTHRDEASLIPEEKLPLINDAVLAACDAKDGVEDGVLDDPRTCEFDPSVLACEGEDGADCLTEAQLDSLELVYAGLKDPAGKQFWPPYEVSSELGWPGHIFEPFSIPTSYFAYMVSEDPEWNWQDFDFSDPANFDVMADAHYRLGPILNATEPDLSAFSELGGKLLMYHGWIDQNIAPQNSINYYQRVAQTMGGTELVEDFMRLFMIPGVGHCNGGPGTDTFDALGALEQWVEEGIAPESIVASHLTDGEADRTRPLCPYPQVAQYKGEGSTDEAENFVCELPE